MRISFAPAHAPSHYAVTLHMREGSVFTADVARMIRTTAMESTAGRPSVLIDPVPDSHEDRNREHTYVRFYQDSMPIEETEITSLTDLEEIEARALELVDNPEDTVVYEIVVLMDHNV